jgi:2-polyprenyl-3-methyl-5-hydroxy-6-metoxy-1,4-benzoquinol methylase
MSVPKVRQLLDRLRGAPEPPAYRPINRSKEQWETQYSGAQWERLRQVDELARYSVITGYCNFFRRDAAILDVGCGEGVWLETFKPNPYRRYLGLDLSDRAVEAAQQRLADSRTSFVAADALEFRSDERFDLIVFNESLYYFDDPLTVIGRYETMLEEGGVVIASMHASDRGTAAWCRIAAARSLLDSTVVTNGSETSWKVACWRRPGPGLGTV